MAPLPDSDEESAPATPGPERRLWQGKTPDAFWKGATLFSLGINLVLIRKHSALATVLRESGRWENAYEDDLAEVFIRPGSQVEAAS